MDKFGLKLETNGYIHQKGTRKCMPHTLLYPFNSSYNNLNGSNFIHLTVYHTHTLPIIYHPVHLKIGLNTVYKEHDSNIAFSLEFSWTNLFSINLQGKPINFSNGCFSYVAVE